MFIVSSQRVEDNLPLLKEAYGFVHNTFSSLGLVLEHDKSEAFHFSRAQRFSNPAIDLGFAPYGEATPLKPKPVWRYLGFFFDRKLLVREHVRFYSTKAFTTVKAFNMLGNSSRGIMALQKRLLYRTCVIPILTYGLRLWHFKGAKFQGVLKTLAKMQRVAALWITGCFRTSPTGGVESLAGLLPMHLLLRQLAEKSCLCATTFSQSHPLRPLMGDGLRGMEQAHRLGLSRSGPLSMALLRSPLVDTTVAAKNISWDEFEPFGVESRPGGRVLDLFMDRISTKRPPSAKSEDIATYEKDLNAPRS
jgi:hypothetical protein